MKRDTAFIAGAILAFLMLGCGVENKVGGVSIPYPTPNFDTDATPAATESVDPVATGSVSPSEKPSEASHLFLRTIGSGVLRAVNSIAASGDYVLVCDQKHRDPISKDKDFSLAIRFGRDGNRQGEGYEWLGLLSRMEETYAVSTDGTTVYVASKGGIFGFAGTTQKVLNLGKAYLPTVAKDLVQTADTLYLLGSNEFSAYSLPTFRPLFKNQENGVGLGIDKDGKVYLATSTSIVCYEDGKIEKTFDGFSDLRDVAADPRNGDLYALTGHCVLRLDAEGKTLDTFGEFEDATSLAIDRDGCVYACDRAKNAVQAFIPSSPLE